MNIRKPETTFLLIAATSGFLSVALGAFAAHGLKQVLNALQLQTFQTGVEYQAIHTLALLGVAVLPGPSRWLHLAGWGFILGIILFSGSLYILTLADMKMLGIITPFGGTLLLIGWACLAVYAWKLRQH